MQFLKLCCVAPHPPIMVPEIGGREVEQVAGSIDAMKRLAAEVRALQPETIVVMSPHSPVYIDAFAVQAERRMSGSFAQFKARGVSLEAEGDEELANAISLSAKRAGLTVAQGKAGTMWGRSGELDHGVLVPLYFLAPPRFRLVCISISFLDHREHFDLGIALRTAIEETGRKTVFVASGDMSHRLLPGAPAGYSPRGKDFDAAVVEIMKKADFSELFRMDPVLIEEAGECGLRSIFALAGAVDGCDVESEVLSYEGPFGVGYMVARVVPGAEDPRRRLVL